MEIITQTLISTVFDTLIKEWRAETMIGVIVFLLTYYFMQKRVNHYRILSELYQKDVETAIAELKKVHEVFTEIKNTLQNVKDERDRKILLQQFETIVKNSLGGLENKED